MDSTGFKLNTINTSDYDTDYLIYAKIDEILGINFTDFPKQIETLKTVSEEDLASLLSTMSFITPEEEGVKTSDIITT